jgi:hypothetical protein
MSDYIRITSAIQGFRRAGLTHTTEPTVYPVADFSKQQLAELEKEPRLVVEFVDAPQADPADDSQGAVGEERLAELVVHIGTLNKEDASLWKADGTPKASAYPQGTTAEERDAAWEAFTAQLDKA